MHYLDLGSLYGDTCMQRYCGSLIDGKYEHLLRD